MSLDGPQDNDWNEVLPLPRHHPRAKEWLDVNTVARCLGLLPPQVLKRIYRATLLDVRKIPETLEALEQGREGTGIQVQVGAEGADSAPLSFQAVRIKPSPPVKGGLSL